VSHACFVCRSDKLTPLIDIGPQPISNRFLRAPGDPEERYPIALGQCEACGLVQIDRPVPAAALVPPYDWIAYNEPEGHLDGLVDILVSLPGIVPGSVAGGVSSKDDSTLARLERQGFKTWRLDLRDDLGVSDLSGQGVETVQDRLTPGRADSIVQRRGRADVLLVRHILEHSSRPLDFIEALKRLVTPNGYVVVEVPDCSRAMDGCDYTTIWEEHTLYYTPDTFRQTFPFAGLGIARTENYPYPFENSLVAIATARSNGAASSPPVVVASERRRGTTFGESFPERREKVRRFLLEHRRSRGPIALFGAGHLACTFVTVFDVADMIECIIDDNPNKRGLYMPGSGLPIVGSSALREDGISLCLLSLNPIGEEKVIGNHQAFVDRGGVFASIFPASAHAMRL
jgi:hypothetical protein